MPNIQISDDLLEFLVRRVDSVPHLEALLLFWENPDSIWTVGEIAARVYVSRDKARGLLHDLARHGFIASTEAEDTYRYQPAWDEAQVMMKLAEVYKRHLIEVAELIHAKAASSSVHEFARAFQFKNKE